MIYVLERFLWPEECEAIVAIMREHLRPSTITFGNPDNRTSTTCDLSLLNNPVIAALDLKIAAALGLQLACGEGIQGQHYELGQEFKPHTDYFEPGTEEYREHCSAQGQRTWTFMVYLNTVEEGGETEFPLLDLKITPASGKAVYWSSLAADGAVNYKTLHAGLPVKKGHKDIVTKWFREKHA